MHFFCGGASHSAEKCFKRIIGDEEKTRAAGDLEKLRAELTPHKCFRCGCIDHIVAKCPKPPRENEKLQKKVRFNERGNRAPQK